MPTTLPDFTLLAYNTATSSENKIHDDTVAAALGFGAGLVPGVDVFAYLCHAPLEHWGERFLREGTASVRFGTPVYDGAQTTVRAEVVDETLIAEAVSGGIACATLTARLTSTRPDPPATTAAPLPQSDDRPPAAPENLPVGRPLGTIVQRLDAEAARAYLADIRDMTSPVDGLGVVHPGWLLRHANSVLSQNVVLGPWIHVGSEINFRQPLPVGTEVRAQGHVSELREHKGHRFVELDVVMLDPSGQVVADVAHTAIYEPRQVRELGTMDH